MRSLGLLVVAASLAVGQAAHARLFWQTYGATAPSPTGCGCAWNLDSDYFVPRYCDSCKYGLFSPCKDSHSRSPACNHLHPAYCGYCTPYGECHYKRRDCVYKERCGCTPLACTYGKWELEKCGKHCKHCKHCPAPCSQEIYYQCGGQGWCGAACGCTCGEDAVGHGPGAAAYMADAGAEYLPNVEPFGGESLGTIQAFPLGMMGSRGAQGGMTGGVPATGMPGGQFMSAPAPTQSPAMSAVLGPNAPSLSAPNLTVPSMSAPSITGSQQ